DRHGQIARTHSVSAGLDYPAVGPEHAALAAHGRAAYTRAADEEAIAAVHLPARTEGNQPTREDAHGVAVAWKRAARQSKRHLVLVNLSGRGDKDLESVMEWDAAHGAPSKGVGVAREDR